MDINLEGIETISYLLQRINDMQIDTKVAEEFKKMRKVSIQEVLVIRIAQEARLNRLTIQHNDRIFWIEDFRNNLLQQIRKPIISEDQLQFKKIKR